MTIGIPYILSTLATLIGWTYWVYIFTSILLKDWAKQSLEKQPARLFWGSFGHTFLVTIMAGVEFILCLELLGFIFLIGGTLSCLGAIVHAAKTYTKSFKERKEQAVYIQNHPLPKRHFWLQDLLISIFAYGLGMSIFATTNSVNAPSTNNIAILAVIFMICIGLGTWVASDIFRRSESLNHLFVRGCYQVGILFAFFTVLPVAWLAWRVWKRTLWQLENNHKTVTVRIAKVYTNY